MKAYLHKWWPQIFWDHLLLRSTQLRRIAIKLIHLFYYNVFFFFIEFTQQHNFIIKLTTKDTHQSIIKSKRELFQIQINLRLIKNHWSPKKIIAIEGIGEALKKMPVWRERYKPLFLGLSSSFYCVSEYKLMTTLI